MFIDCLSSDDQTHKVLEPESHASHPARLLRAATFGAHIVRGASEAARPFHADVGGELATEFIAQAQASRRFGQALADTAFRVVLAIELQFGTRLQNQSLGQQQLVAAFDTQRRTSATSHVARRLQLEPVGGEALDAESQPLTARAFSVIHPNAELGVPVRCDGVPPEKLGTRFFELSDRKSTRLNSS